MKTLEAEGSLARVDQGPGHAAAKVLLTEDQTLRCKEAVLEAFAPRKG